MTPIERAKQILGPLVQHQKATRCVFEDHEDKHKSAMLYPDGFYCNGCNRGLDTLGYYAYLNNLTTRQALVKLGAFSGVYKPPPPTSKAVQDFAESLISNLVGKPEYALAKSWARDIKRLKIPEETTLQCLTDQTFLDACRHKGFNPLLVHDLLFMEVA